MHLIRPYELFRLIEGRPSEKTVHTALPHRRAAGGLTLLETFVLIAASKVVAAKHVFEFGTFFGSTTLNLALNTPDDASIFTLDLDEDHVRTAEQDSADAPLTELHLASKASLDFLGSPVESKISTLTGNSILFDFSRWQKSVDLIFVDGGHDSATVMADTENAFNMASRSKASCILWHDYTNDAYTALTAHLDELSRREQLVHVGDTMLCAWFNDPDERIWPRLLAKT